MGMKCAGGNHVVSIICTTTEHSLHMLTITQLVNDLPNVL